MVNRLAARVRAIPPILVDGLLALGLMGSAAYVAYQDGRLTSLHVLTIALITLPVTFRRRMPILVVWIVGAALLLNLSAGFSNSFFESFAGLIALYTVVVQSEWGVLMALTFVVMLVGLHVSFAIDWHNKGHVNLADLPYNYLIFAVTIVLGYGVRTRRAYIGQLDERSRLLTREAAVEERNRIARELHDVVAHSVSVMVLQATAGARVARRDPAEAAQSFDVIATTGRQALSDLRRVVGVLRTEGEPKALVEPQPGLDQLQMLVDAVRRAGMEVDFTMSGLRRPLPRGVELSAYRVVQESLTNVLKHANAQHAEVAVTYGDSDLELEICDDGHGSITTNPGGSGLIGMRERIGLFGGELVAGRFEGGFRVRARFPLETAHA
jgi:signal transduction histidine kinase